MVKSQILEQLEEVLKRGLGSKIPANSSNAITLETWLSKAIEVIKKYEADAPATLKLEFTRKIESLSRIITQNERNYKEREKKYWGIMSDLRRRLDETQKKLPPELRGQEDFICFKCGLSWNRNEFLTMTDDNGEEWCWQCVDERTRKAGKDVGREIIIDSTSASDAVLTFKCEFCGLNTVGEPRKAHLTNVPDGRDSLKITNICTSCLRNRAKKDLNIKYCPYLTGPRDSYDLPEYDCNCNPKIN